MFRLAPPDVIVHQLSYQFAIQYHGLVDGSPSGVDTIVSGVKNIRHGLSLRQKKGEFNLYPWVMRLPRGNPDEEEDKEEQEDDGEYI